MSEAQDEGVQLQDGIKRVVSLANLMRRQAAAVEDAQAALEAAKEAHRRTEQEDLPDLMRELGVTSLRLEDGTTLSLSEDVQAGISEANRPRAHDWLRANGFAGLIKTEVTVPFGRGEWDAAQKFAENIAQSGNTCAVKEAVHPATLKSFVREQLEAGKPIPMDLFSVHPFTRARLANR